MFSKCGKSIFLSRAFKNSKTVIVSDLKRSAMQHQQQIKRQAKKKNQTVRKRRENKKNKTRCISFADTIANAIVFWNFKPKKNREKRRKDRKKERIILSSHLIRLNVRLTAMNETSERQFIILQNDLLEMKLIYDATFCFLRCDMTFTCSLVSSKSVFFLLHPFQSQLKWFFICF